jgi:hypothetical protein
MDPSLMQPSLLWYLARTYLFTWGRPSGWKAPPPLPADASPALGAADTASEAY